MSHPDYVYTTYIKTTPEKLWQAIINPEFTRQYWGHDNISDWKPGSEWKHADEKKGIVRIVGKVVESNPPQRLVLTWSAPDDLSDVSQVAFEIEQLGEMVRLTIVHGGFKEGSLMPSRISIGWPRVLCSLKSLLETGHALDTWAGHNSTCNK